MVYVCVSTLLRQLRILLIICGMHQDITETVGDIPVHIGAVHLKQILYEKVQPLWMKRTQNFPLPVDNIIMRHG